MAVLLYYNLTLGMERKSREAPERKNLRWVYDRTIAQVCGKPESSLLLWLHGQMKRKRMPSSAM